jgi:hypothetical protein
MQDDHADKNERLKATMRQKANTNLNKDGGAGQVPCGPSQDHSVKRPRGHVNPGTGQKS